MKNIMLLGVTALFWSTSCAQTSHTFYVTPEPFVSNCGTTLPDTTFMVGDTVTIINSCAVIEYWNAGWCPGVLPYYGPYIPLGGTIKSFVVPESPYTDNYFTAVDNLMNNGSTIGFGFKYSVISLAGVEEKSDENFSVYPIPTADHLKINGDNIESIKVFDMTGRLVLSESFNQSYVKLDIMNLTNGNYILYVNDSEPIKFIKN